MEVISKEHLPKPKVLLVDDIQSNLTLLARFLEELDLELVFALSGLEALKLATEHDFALVLLDIHMPGMDGYQTAQGLRELDSNDDLPIIFITSDVAQKKYQFIGYQTGAVDYLFKPVEKFLLISKVRIFCELFEKKALLEMKNEELGRANQQNREKLRAIENSFREITQHFIEKSEALIETIRGIDNAFEEATTLTNSTDPEHALRRKLIKLMNLTLEYWETGTGKSKIDLAEESELWRVSLDGSVPRVKTLDKYLHLNNLPKKPRWKTVIDTAEFVLANAPASPRLRPFLESSLAEFRGLIQKANF